MKGQRTKRARAASDALVELTVVEVLAGDDAGPRARLRAVGSGPSGLAEIVVPMGIVESTHLHGLLGGIRLGRASWQALYLTSLAAAGMEVAAIELESRPDLLTASVFLRPAGARKPARRGRPGDVAIAAPTDAAILLASEVEAPIYATTETMLAFAAGERGRPRQAGAALLADLLAHLPDEDFGKWKM